MMNVSQKRPSEFLDLAGIEYFRFEEDFIEQNVRCIPMIVRFKMDAAGIKLKLAEWSKFGVAERKELAVMKCSTSKEVSEYRIYLEDLVRQHTGHAATSMEIEAHPAWANHYAIPLMVDERASESGIEISLLQWRELTNLQRFALIKLSRPGHESKNFIKALQEFGINENR
jgi:hypothetical protein